MNTTLVLAIALALIIAGAAGWAVTCARLRRRIRELEHSGAQLQGEIESRMDRWQASGVRRAANTQPAHRQAVALQAGVARFTHNVVRMEEHLRQSVVRCNRALTALERELLPVARRVTAGTEECGSSGARDRRPSVGSRRAGE